MSRIASKPNPIPLPSLVWPAVLLAALVVPPRSHAAEAGCSAARCSLTFECAQPYVTQRQVGWLLGTDNFGQTHDRREALNAEVARACAAGVARVRIEAAREGVSGTYLSQH